jgi:hypothetical protein
LRLKGRTKAAYFGGRSLRRYRKRAAFAMERGLFGEGATIKSAKTAELGVEMLCFSQNMACDDGYYLYYLTNDYEQGPQVFLLNSFHMVPICLAAP